jgi:spore germination protein GerM
MGSDKDCAQVFPVTRTILNAETFGPGALEQLLKGVSDTEKTAGYSTSINGGVLLQKFEVKNKVAYVDFSSGLDEKTAGSCRVTAIRAQIENTLNNLSDIDSTIISINGKTAEILQP